MLDYEAIRQKNVEDNKKVLASIGVDLDLLDAFKSVPNIAKRQQVSKPAVRPKKRPATTLLDIDNFNGGSIFGPVRKSARVLAKLNLLKQENVDGSTLEQNSLPCNDGSEVSLLMDEDEPEDESCQVSRENIFGDIPDIEVGTVWQTRLECCRSGVHRLLGAGIHSGKEGAYSIVLSGGYEDDIDLGECFTYTGSGRKNLKKTKSKSSGKVKVKKLQTAKKSKGQTLIRGTLALSNSVITTNPVRVIRGYTLNTPFAPESGYRYDGLYTVEKSWSTTGLSGHKVWRFALKRCDNQAPPTWEFTSELDSAENMEEDGKKEEGV